MKILSYLAFTLLSIVIQFCVIDYIQGNIQNDDVDKLKYLNGTSQKKRLSDIIKDFDKKPHALYYRTATSKLLKKSTEPGKHNNLSLPEISVDPVDVTTETSTLIDLLYDENSSVTEDTFTTESMFATVDIDNVTEITLFEKSNATTIKPTITTPKRKYTTTDCDCNLLHKVCDINCCCDADCSDNERKLFPNCIGDNADRSSDHNDNDCIPHDSFYSRRDGFDSFFCITKTNLPEKRVVNRVVKHDETRVNQHYKWHSNDNTMEVMPKLKRKLFEYGDPMWILNNGSCTFIDLPIPLVNSFCNGRKAMMFLRDEQITCTVKLKDLESFYTLTNLQGASLLSFTEKSLNSSAMNCSTVHCTNWTILICDEETCTIYNKSLHEPLCTDNICTYIAFRMDYIFYYHENKIINATIKLFTRTISLRVPFITQEISVKFVMANVSIDRIVKLSGNPGYIRGLPVIVSYSESNHTELFYNTSDWNKYLLYPSNDNGGCTVSINADNYVRFGMNKRIKCRFVFVPKEQKIDKDTCDQLHKSIKNMFGFGRSIVVSPFGNPQDIADEDWLPFEIDKNETPVYGAVTKETSKLHCFNLVTRMTVIFTYANVATIENESEMKVLSAKMDATRTNASFGMEDISVVVTIDSMFIDETKPSVFQYAGGPHLNIHLPRDFFFPFPSNNSITNKSNLFLIFFITFLFK